GARDGAGAQAMFRRPLAVAIAPDGSAWVADSDNHVIRRVELTPPYNVSTIAGKFFSSGYADGVPDAARFNRPTSIAFDAQGNLFVTDQANSRIRRVDAVTHAVTTVAGSGAKGAADAKTTLVSTIAGTGRQGTHLGTGDASDIVAPAGLALLSNGALLVSDSYNNAVRKIVR